MKYLEYLKTTYWLNKRKEILEFWNNECSVCSSRNNLHVHHRKYNLFNEKITDCIVLCSNCHGCSHSKDILEFEMFNDNFDRLQKNELDKICREIAILKDSMKLASLGFESEVNKLNISYISNKWGANLNDENEEYLQELLNRKEKIENQQKKAKVLSLLQGGEDV